MSIISVTAWNFGDTVKSKEYQYVLHCLSVSEKDQTMEELWQQHSHEMQALEGNVFIFCGQ